MKSRYTMNVILEIIWGKSLTKVVQAVIREIKSAKT